MNPTDVAPPAVPRRDALRMAAAACALPLLGAAGCAAVEPARYAAEKPELDLRRYFTGDVEAWGMFQGRDGEVKRRFTVLMRCSWNGDTGVLDEDFTYADGTKERRVWTVKREGEGRWSGTAADVVGRATGVSAGNALNWRYTLALVVDGRTWHVDFDDWMYLVDERTVVNRATMSKFGIRLGEVTLFFRRPA